MPGPAIEEPFVEIPHERLFQFWNGLERAGPQTIGLHCPVIGLPGSGANGGALEKGLLLVATSEVPILLETSPCTRDSAADSGCSLAKSRTGNVVSRPDDSDSDWAAPLLAGGSRLCRFIQRASADTDRVWDENRIHMPPLMQGAVARGEVCPVPLARHIGMRLGRMKPERRPTLHGRLEPSETMIDLC